MPRRKLQDLSIIQNPPNSEGTNSDQQSAIGSSNVPNTVHELVEIQTENGGRRKVRGHTLLKDLYNLNSVKHVKISRNSHGQPIGLEARLLAGYLGIIVRNANLLPINYESWHHMPDSNKNHALDNIKERFALEVSNNYVKKALANKWRDHKSTLRKEYFKKNISLEEKLRNVPFGMLRYQWEDAAEISMGEAMAGVFKLSKLNSKSVLTPFFKFFTFLESREKSRLNLRKDWMIQMLGRMGDTMRTPCRQESYGIYVARSHAWFQRAELYDGWSYVLKPPSIED
ncbi:hypothetical protein CXB51_001694 [Gossypium anomalum]|uniref:Uncharacterized protein n=1 Tax=Gossypium anomalum TaxID=47600 RepID=A0A8J5ZM04_9ROSI|nr:hypothetical protein CXB51_001694 [Gossypium anomalum]